MTGMCPQNFKPVGLAVLAEPFDESVSQPVRHFHCKRGYHPRHTLQQQTMYATLPMPTNPRHIGGESHKWKSFKLNSIMKAVFSYLGTHSKRYTHLSEILLNRTNFAHGFMFYQTKFCCTSTILDTINIPDTTFVISFHLKISQVCFY